MRVVCALALAMAACRFDIDRVAASDGAVSSDGASSGDGASGGGDGTLPEPGETAENPIRDPSSYGFDYIDFEDDRQSLCGYAGGRDVFFEIDLPIEQVVYLSTYGSTAPLALSVQPGPCVDATSSANCIRGTCGDDADWAVVLPAGVSCVIVDEVTPQAGSVQGLLTVILTGAMGLPAFPNVSADTCAEGDEHGDASCGAGAGPDAAWYFTLCPGESVIVEAEIDSCSPGGREATLVMRGDTFTGVEWECDRGACGTAEPRLMGPVSGHGLYWIILDGASAGDCGPTDVAIAITPQ